VKDFPVDVIPHMSEEELLNRSKERQSKNKNIDQIPLEKNLKQSTISTKDNENMKSPELNR
jgi:hypothetical protein